MIISQNEKITVIYQDVKVDYSLPDRHKKVGKFSG